MKRKNDENMPDRGWGGWNSALVNANSTRRREGERYLRHYGDSEAKNAMCGRAQSYSESPPGYCGFPEWRQTVVRSEKYFETSHVQCTRTRGCEYYFDAVHEIGNEHSAYLHQGCSR